MAISTFTSISTLSCLQNVGSMTWFFTRQTVINIFVEYKIGNNEEIPKNNKKMDDN